MKSKLLSRAVAAHATVALLGVSILAACESDRVTAPSPVANAPTTTQSYVIPAAWAYLGSGFIDLNHNPVGGGVMLLRDSTGSPLSLVADGAPNDYDNRVGEIRFKLPRPGTFQICFASAPVGFAFPYNNKPCITQTVQPYTSVHIDEFLLVPAPSVVWTVMDNATAKFVGPSSFTISSPRMPYSIEVVDNGKNDLNPAVGGLLAKVPAAGTYTLCQTVAPLNYYLANPACRSVDVTSGGNVFGGTFWNTLKPMRQ